MPEISFSPLAVIKPSQMRSSGWLSAVAKSLMGPSRIQPRKGASPSDMGGAQGMYGSTAPKQWKQQDSHLVQRQRWLSLPGYSLLELANRDDIIFSIRNTLKRAIGEMEWQIAPDLDNIKADLKRWQTVTCIRIAHPSFPIDFSPQAISPEFFYAASGELRDLIRNEFGESLDGDDDFNPDRSVRLREFFERCLSFHEAIAESHINQVKETLLHPNPSADSSFRALLNRMIDDITIFDGAALIKNPRTDGTPGELYTVPGRYIRVYMCNDLSTPQPPFAAYDWFQDAKIKAFYTNPELIYMMMNPQEDGYGKPPMEVLLEQMVGSLYGDQWLVDQFQNNNTPFFVFDLGPNVNQGERDAVEKEWDNRVRKGQHRGIFIGAKEGVKGFLPVPSPSNKDQEVLELLKFWAARKCAAFGLSLNDIGFTEDLHRTTAETQAELTETRGVQSHALCIQEYLNSEYVKGSMWVRRDPQSPDSMDGYVVKCFPFNDVIFKFCGADSGEELEDAQRAVTLIDAGVLTRNEVRKDLHYPPREGGDVLTISTASSSLMRVEDLPELSYEEQKKQEEAQQQQNGFGKPGADGSKPADQAENGQPKADVPPPGKDDSQTEKRLLNLRDDLVKFLGE